MSELIIETGHAERHYWADLWRHRELFFPLSWRGILEMYRAEIQKKFDEFAAFGKWLGVVRPSLEWQFCQPQSEVEAVQI